jgi:hypothetical protein
MSTDIPGVAQSACLVSLGNARDADCLPISRIKTVSKPLLLIALRLPAELTALSAILKECGGHRRSKLSAELATTATML